MIKLKVEWRHECPGCGTLVVVDYLDDNGCCCLCPWCGRIEDADTRPASEEMRSYLTRAVKEIEEKANDIITARIESTP